MRDNEWTKSSYSSRGLDNCVEARTTLVRGDWAKSSYSQGGMNNCVEARTALVRDEWAKSSYSQGGADNCLEARTHETRIVDVRDSQHPHLGHLTFDEAEWRSFLAGIDAL